ncbi:MAG: N-acetylmannosamine-6-phosphate 2-epimerase [Atopobiaceae bacterium]|jgi:N-acylglucosamine-6-phosphate 2-epimerase|nr:N-acetylmannosamine-6-phosphate 2-epimerase [Atopobiaceae bacterium]
MKTNDPARKAMLESMKGGLIVSCQVQRDDPIYTDDMVVKMAEAAEWAGAVGIRANSPEQISAIKAAVKLPVIGLWKVWHDDTDVFITPTMREVEAIMEAGADIVALDCTAQATHEGTQAWDLLPQVKKSHPEVATFADVSNIAEARRAAANGADIVAPTLYGYTAETAGIEGADYRMFAEMCRELGDEAYVMMEGHVYTPEDAMKCVFLGAHSVIVGSAITRPHLTAKRFVDLLGGYQDNWRDAERAHH